MNKERMIMLMMNRENVLVGFVEGEGIKKDKWVETKNIIESADGYLLEQKLVCGNLEIEFKNDKEEKELLQLIQPEDIKWIGIYENGMPMEVTTIPEERGKMVEKDKVVFMFGKEENIKNIDAKGKEIKFVNMDEVEKEKNQ